MRLLSWNEFNTCVKSITEDCKDIDLSGVYGFPRGGICIAVALSHSLFIPLLKEPQPKALIVDDVYETGATLDLVRDIPGVHAFVWHSKVIPDWWNAVEISESNEWLVFPWENKLHAKEEENAYRLSRTNMK